MSLFTLFSRGLGLTLRKHRLAFRLWAVNFLFALLITAPAAFLLINHAGHSLGAKSILKKLDVHWLTDLSSRFLDTAPAVTGLLIAAACLYLLLAVFLNGAIIGCLNRHGARTTLADFFHDGGLFFWRFLRLFLLSIPTYLLVLGACFPLLRVLLAAVNRRAATEWPVLVAGNARILFLLLLLGLVSMFFDYVKIGLATSGRRSVLKEAWLTLKFLKRRFFRAWGLTLLAGLAFVLLTLFYLEIARLLPKDRPLLVLIFFLWQQLYILGRQLSKVLFFATEIEFFRQQTLPAQEKTREE
jgi:hypothetical protein